MPKIKAGDALKKILAKHGQWVNDWDAAIDELNASSIEIDDFRVNLVNNAGLTEEEALERYKTKFESTIKDSVMAQFYGSVDNQLLPNYVKTLDDKSKAEFEKLEKTKDKIKFMFDYFQDRSTASGDAKVFKKELEALQAKLGTEYVPKTQFEEVSSSVSNYKKKVLEKEILTNALFSDNIAKEVKNQRWFKNQFLQDTNEYLAKQGYEIDPDTYNIKKSGSENDFVLKEGTAEKMGINDLIPQMVSTYTDYQKKSGGGSSSDTIDVDTGGSHNNVVPQGQSRLTKYNEMLN